MVLCFWEITFCLLLTYTSHSQLCFELDFGFLKAILSLNVGSRDVSHRVNEVQTNPIRLVRMQVCFLYFVQQIWTNMLFFGYWILLSFIIIIRLKLWRIVCLLIKRSIHFFFFSLNEIQVLIWAFLFFFVLFLGSCSTLITQTQASYSPQYWTYLWQQYCIDTLLAVRSVAKGRSQLVRTRVNPSHTNSQTVLTKRCSSLLYLLH